MPPSRKHISARFFIPTRESAFRALSLCFTHSAQGLFLASAEGMSQTHEGNVNVKLLQCLFPSACLFQATFSPPAPRKVLESVVWPNSHLGFICFELGLVTSGALRFHVIKACTSRMGVSLMQILSVLRGTGIWMLEGSKGFFLSGLGAWRGYGIFLEVFKPQPGRALKRLV